MWVLLTVLYATAGYAIHSDNKIQDPSNKTRRRESIHIPLSTFHRLGHHLLSPIRREDFVHNPLDKLRLPHLHVLLAHSLPTLRTLDRPPPLRDLLFKHCLSCTRKSCGSLQAQNFRLRVLERVCACTQLDVRGPAPVGDAVLLREENTFNGIEWGRSGVKRRDCVRARRGEGEV